MDYRSSNQYHVYINILEAHLLPIRPQYRCYVLLHDNTRAHTENQMLFDLQLLVKKSGPSLRSIDDVLSYRNAEGATPLHIASANGYQNVVEYLLQQNVSINLQDADGWTPIHAAAFWCQQGTLSKRNLIKWKKK